MPLSIHKSSAGSGKTYTLAKQYLKLSLRSPEYYQKILAVTFTNKAAEEMKDRVLEFLIAISNGKHELIHVYASEMSLTTQAIRQRAKDALTHILHHYSFFNITTIDTFFHRVIRAFSREIGLQGSFSIEMDTNKVTEVISGDLFQGIEGDKGLKEWLVRFAMNRLENGKGYDFKNEVQALASQLFTESFKTIADGQSENEDIKLKINQLQENLFQQKYTYENQLKKMAEQFFKLLQQNSLEPIDLRGGKRSAIVSFFNKLINKNYKELINETIQKSLKDPLVWSSKSSKNLEKIVGLAENNLIPLLRETTSYIQAHEANYFTSVAVLKHLYTLGLLSDLSKRLQDYKQEEEVIMISDLSDFLNQIINDSDTPFIYEKVGNRYNHYFIDEFQDTSSFQWQNFKPLIQESLASGHESIIVGDAKQSIYRWRGGDPSLLMYQVAKDVPDTFIQDKNQVNYRSASNIVSFNNAIFSRLPQMVQEQTSDYIEANISQVLAEAYEGSEQIVADRNKSKDGLVNVQFFEKQDFYEQSLNKTTELIERLRNEKHSLDDMAILVRQNKEAELITNHFLAYNQQLDAEKKPIDIISAEGMLLDSSSVVQLLLTTFRYLTNQQDAVIEKELIFQYVNVVLNQKTVNHQDFASLNESLLPSKFKKYQQHFLQLPIYELTEVLIRVFSLNDLSTEFAYLQAFQDAVLDFSKNHRSDIRKFLAWWDEIGVKRSVKLISSPNAIQIVTAHKSKGLQFPIVIIPFCDFELNSRAHISWYETPNHEPYQLVKHAPVNYESQLANTYFERSYQQELVDAYLESLNLLYVAFTRAENGLYAFALQPPNDDKTPLAHVGKLLWRYFKENEDMKGWDAANQLFEIGSLKVEEKNDPKVLSSLKHYPSNKWSDRLKIKKNNESLLEEETISKRQEGVMLHQILSEIIHYSETKAVLDKYENRMEITKEDRQRFEKILMNLWEDESIKVWFNGEGEVKTEVVVLPKDGEVKRLDRVVIKKKSATVIDFKSGEPKPGDEKQLKAYVKLLKDMGYQSDGQLLYLHNADLRKV